MELKGEIGYFSIGEVLYLLSHFRKTGRLVIKKQGEIYILNGKAVHSIYKNLKGIEAFYNLSIITKGEFEFMANERSPEITIDKTSSELFNEIEKRSNIISELEKELPPLNAVPVKSQSTPKEKVALRKSDWKLLIKVNGKNDIKHIIEESGVGVLKAMKTLSWLFQQNLIYDPEAKKRILNKGVKKINLILEALGDGPWWDEIKNFFAKTKLNGYIDTKDNKIEIEEKDVNLTDKELKDIFDKGIEELKNSASRTLGKVLALKKIQNALTKVE